MEGQVEQNKKKEREKKLCLDGHILDKRTNERKLIVLSDKTGRKEERKNKRKRERKKLSGFVRRRTKCLMLHCVLFLVV